MTTMNRRAAKATGYRALTSRLHLPEEQGMLDGVLVDMRRGNIGHVLLRDRLGVSVWRSLRTATVAAACSQFSAVFGEARSPGTGSLMTYAQALYWLCAPYGLPMHSEEHLGVPRSA
jgi:hypothetical protein